MPDSLVALGLVPHTGWAHSVTVAGDAHRPRVLHRERVELVPAGVERFAYHLVKDWPLAKATRSVTEAHAAVRATTRQVLGHLADTAGTHGRVVGLSIVGRPHDVPEELAAILAKHHLLHAAEGELFLSAVLDAADDLGLPVTLLAPKGTVEQAATILGTPPGSFADRLTALRAELGAPWQADHKAATAAALVALQPA